jgi:hypothetical protein
MKKLLSILLLAITIFAHAQTSLTADKILAKKSITIGATASNFIGTVESGDVIFKRNNIELMRMGSSNVNVKSNFITKGLLIQNTNPNLFFEYFPDGFFRIGGLPYITGLTNRNYMLVIDTGFKVITQCPINTSIWKTTGNSQTIAGTHFIGTTDNQDLVFKINNLEVIRFYSNMGKESLRFGRFAKSNALHSAAFQVSTASGDNSFSCNTGQALEEFSFAANAGVANGYSSIAFNNSYANAYASFAAGQGVKSQSAIGFSIGSFNDSSLAANRINSTFTPLNRAFEIGVGTSDDDRKNAMTVLYNGHIGLGTTTPIATLHVIKTGSDLSPAIIAGCSTYTDDAAAGTGGLTAGMLYKKADGTLMVKL